MRRPARNLLYVVLGFVCVALLVQGVGLKLPGILRALTAVSGATLSSPSSDGSQAASPGAVIPSAYASDKACTASSAIETSFNSTPIAEGNFIWFNSSMRVDGLGSDAATIFLNDSMINFAANGTNYSLPVPAGGLPGGISSVTWSAAFSTDTPGVTGDWGWGAAVYTTIGTDYNALAVNPADGGQPSQGATLLSRAENNENGAGQMDSVGKPASLEAFVTGGAGSDGGSNFTGSLGAMSEVTPCAAGASAQPRTNTRTTITLSDGSGAGTNGVLVTTGLAISKTCPSVEPPGAAFQCTFFVQNRDPVNTV